MDKDNNVLETPRLILRRWRENDAEALFRYASDGRVSEMALWPRHTSVEMSREVIRAFFAPNRDCLAMVLKETGEAIGCIGLVPEGDNHYPVAGNEREVGYWIGHPHWGKGLTSEALKSLAEYCRDCLGLDSLLITTDAINVSSQRVAVKCGFVHVEDYKYDGTPSKAYRLALRHTPKPSGMKYSLRIERKAEGKRDYMPLLLVGDECSEMIGRYIDSGTLYVGFVGDTAVAVCMTVELDEDTVEVKNLAVREDFRRMGIGGRMLGYIEKVNAGSTIMLGTGESPSNLRFYAACGYRYSHRVTDFFTDNYPEPIVEEGIVLKDMIYLSKKQSPAQKKL